MKEKGILKCGWCHKEIGKNGDHLKFIKFIESTEMYHKETCYEKAKKAARREDTYEL